MWHRFVGYRSRLFIALTDFLVFLHFGFVRPAFEVRTKCGAPFLQLKGVVLTIFRVIYVHFETDLHLLGLLILLHLLDHRNLSPPAPGELGNLIDVLQLRILHAFLQSACPTHLRLHFRIDWDVNYSFNELPQNVRAFCRWHLHQISRNFFHSIKELNMWCFLCFLDVLSRCWAVRHNSLVNELVFSATRAEPAPSSFASAALDESPCFSERFGLLEPASLLPRALDIPMNSSKFSNLGNVCLLAHVVEGGFIFTALDDLDLHCIFDLLVYLGHFLSGRVVSLRRHLEDVGLLHGWLDTCVRKLFTGPLLDAVLRFSPTAYCRSCVSSTCCVIFGTLMILSITSGFCR